MEEMERSTQERFLFFGSQWTKQGLPHQVTHSSQPRNNKQKQTQKPDHMGPAQPFVPVPGTVLHTVGAHNSG